MFGAQASTPAFGTPASTPAFSSSPLFGTPSSTPVFSTPGFGTPSTPSFATGFGASSPFSSVFPQQTQQQQPSNPFQSPSPSTGFGFQTSSSFPATSSALTPFPTGQLTTLMAPVSPLPFSLADRDVQAIIDAYNDEPGNPKYAFKHLLFSVTEPQYKVKPSSISDIMWAEAMGKLEGMDTVDRERLWPQLVHGFKDLSQRLKLQDEVIASDSERLKTTQTNVKKLQWHIQSETIPRIQRLKQKEQDLQRRLLRIMRVLEALESKGYRLPLTKEELELAEKLASFTRKLKGSEGDLSRRVQNLLTTSRAKANRIGAGGSLYLPGSTKIDEQSFADMLEVLQQQTVGISRLTNVLKRDIRDLEIMSDNYAQN